MAEGGTWRHVQNIFFGCVIITTIFNVCMLISGILFVSWIWGVDHVNLNAIRPSFDHFPRRLKPFMFTYILDWWHNPAKYNTLLRAKLFCSIGLPFCITGIFIYSFRAQIMKFRFFDKEESLHGDARWADDNDVRDAGLRSKAGMLLGKYKGKLLIAGGYQHALLFAPTGSGKGVGFVVPNCVYWEDSLVVHDIKGENFELSSGYRKNVMGQKVFSWNPASVTGITHCYNPLEFISNEQGKMVDDSQKIMSLLLPEQEFWTNEARSFGLGILLKTIAKPNIVASFAEIYKETHVDDVAFQNAVDLDTLGGKMHPVAIMNLSAFANKAQKEQSGVLSTFNSSIELWANPLLCTATNSSDFDFHEFRKVKNTIYIILTPDNIERLRPLMQIVYQQAAAIWTQYLPKDDEPHGVMLMIDEFPTLGKMEIIKNGIAYFRGYRVRLFLVVQDTEQLKGAYEQDGMNSFLSNSTYRITFAANNIDTANLISQTLGNKTVNADSVNLPKYLDIDPSKKSIHRSKQQRALLLPQEVINLPRDEQILMIEACNPIKCTKIKYYEDPMFRKRILDKIPVPTQEPYDAGADNSKISKDDDSKTVSEGEADKIENKSNNAEPKEEEVEEIHTEDTTHKYSGAENDYSDVYSNAASDGNDDEDFDALLNQEDTLSTTHKSNIQEQSTEDSVDYDTLIKDLDQINDSIPEMDNDKDFDTLLNHYQQEASPNAQAHEINDLDASEQDLSTNNDDEDFDALLNHYKQALDDNLALDERTNKTEQNTEDINNNDS